MVPQREALRHYSNKLLALWLLAGGKVDLGAVVEESAAGVAVLLLDLRNRVRCRRCGLEDRGHRGQVLEVFVDDGGGRRCSAVAGVDLLDRSEAADVLEVLGPGVGLALGEPQIGAVVDQVASDEQLLTAAVQRGGGRALAIAELDDP